MHTSCLQESFANTYKNSQLVMAKYTYVCNNNNIPIDFYIQKCFET